MASPQSVAIDNLFDSFLNRLAANPEMELEELRDMLEECGDLARDPGGVDYLEVDANGTPCLWAVPSNADKDRVLMCFHGGGCVTGSRFSHRKMFAHIAKAAGCRALILDYARAPENPYPSQINEGILVYQWLTETHGITPDHIATIGDSAGGNLCTSVVLAMQEKNLSLPAAVMPLSPWYDMEATADSFETNASKDKLITRELSLSMSAMYLGDTPPNNPLANPVHATYRGFPPMYIQAGGFEAIVDDATRVADKAAADGVEVKCDIFPEMQHVFQFMAGKAPEADDAIQRIAQWLRPKLGLS